MNKKQLLYLWIGITIIVLMGLFPPWHYKSGATIRGQMLCRYKFILTPAQSPNRDYEFLKATINLPRLFVQWSMIGLITTGFIITFKKQH